jgi:hypothetical protein
MSTPTNDDRARDSRGSLGSLADMPPEQLRGETDSLDARCDVYSLGASL